MISAPLLGLLLLSVGESPRPDHHPAEQRQPAPPLPLARRRFGVSSHDPAATIAATPRLQTAPDLGRSGAPM